MELPIDLDHPSWKSAAGVLGGYGAILALMTVLLFGLPLALFIALG
ncbi:hypothetical protein [Haloarchaeobius sp. HME9146]|nr:hypothetical protein [Haloarchaeobius sp. HME9146]MCT9096079.1 hypothetical protein [Haloarchaeobius sp. HME9146]